MEKSDKDHGLHNDAEAPSNFLAAEHGQQQKSALTQPDSAQFCTTKPTGRASVKFGKSLSRASSDSGDLEASSGTVLPSDTNVADLGASLWSALSGGSPFGSTQHVSGSAGMTIPHSQSKSQVPGTRAISSHYESAMSVAGGQGVANLPPNTMGSRPIPLQGLHHSIPRSGLPQSVAQAIRKATLPRQEPGPSVVTDSTPAGKDSAAHTQSRAKDEVIIDSHDMEESESELARNLLATPKPVLKRFDRLPPWLASVTKAAVAWWQFVFANPSAKEWSIFDRLMFILDIWYLLVVPWISGFCCDEDVNFKGHYLFLDIALILRVIINIYRPKVDSHGQLVLDVASKRRQYFLHMYGWYEAIGALPIDWIPILMAIWAGSADASFNCTQPIYFYQNGSISSIFNETLPLADVRHMYSPNEIPNLLLIYSVLRFFRLISTVRTISWFLQIQIPFTSSPVSRLIKNLLIALYISHLDTCMWWILQSVLDPEDRWANIYYVAVDHKTHELTSQPMRYVATFFVCLRALFFVPRDRTYNGSEYVYQCCELLAAAILSGSIIGNLSAVIRLYDRQATLDKAGTFMVQKRFPVTLQKKVLDQIDFEWIHQRGMDMERMFAELPRSIFLEVCVHLYYALVSSVPLFEGADDVFKVAMCERIFVINVLRGFYICKAGDAGGNVEILTKDESKVLTTLGPNSFFGEIALFQECKRTATARTTEDSELCVLKKEDFDEILEQHPAMVELFRRTVAERQERDQKRLQEQKAAKDQGVEETTNPKLGVMQSISNLAGRGQSIRKLFNVGTRGPGMGGSTATVKTSRMVDPERKEIRAPSSLSDADHPHGGELSHGSH